MKHLTVAFGISLGASILLFAVFTLIFAIDVHAAAGIAGLPFIASHQVYETLERESGKKQIASEQHNAVPSQEQFFMSWKLGAALIALFIFGAMQLTPLVGVASDFIVSKLDDPRVYFAVALPLNLIAAYSVGRGVAMRVTHHGILSVVVGVAAGVMLAHLFDFLFVSADPEIAFIQAHNLGELFVKIGSGFVILSVASLIGYWRGRSYRLARYFRYLLSILPKDTRETLVGIAFEEARALGSRRPTPRTDQGLAVNAAR
jgi:hypothetical protein